MRILIISNQHAEDGAIGNPVLQRMIASLRKDNRVIEVNFAHFGRGSIAASLRHIAAEARHHDLIHVHFGGLYALLVWTALLWAKSPKLITFHGTDIHAKAIKTASSVAEKIKIRLNQWASFICIMLYDRHGYVASELQDYLPQRLRKWRQARAFVQPLGVDYSLFTPRSQKEARERLHIDDGKWALFSDVSQTKVKRRDIAERIVGLMPAGWKLLVMSGVRPTDVPDYICASDLLLLTSDEEGSPNIIRECLALNRRVYSVDVGDARQQLQGLRNSEIISREPEEAARQITASLEKDYNDNTRDTLRERIDLELISRHLVDFYQEVRAGQQ